MLKTEKYNKLKVYTDTMGSYSNTREVNRGSFLLLFLLLSVFRNVHFLQTRLTFFRGRSYQRIMGGGGGGGKKLCHY